MKEPQHQIRIMIMLVLFFAGLLGLAVRLYWLQNKKGPTLSERVNRQHNGVLQLQPERGLIYDRGQTLLSLNSDRPSLRLNGKTWNPSGNSVQHLAQAVEMEPKQLQSRIDRILQRIQKSPDQVRSGVLIYSIDPRQEAAIKALQVPGLYFSAGTGRIYPNGNLAASTLGFVGLEGKGLVGMELYAEPYLRGIISAVPTLRDGFGTNLLYTDVTQDDSCRGADVILTLDQYIQFLAEKEIEKIATKYHPLWASIVVMDPYRGEVLSIANYPTFNPNQIERSEATEWKNYAIYESFEPGSTIKPFAIAGALEDQTLLPATPIYCENGRYRIFKHTIRDDVHAYEWLTVEEIIAYSSNIGAVKVAQIIGEERLHEVLSNFGFGSLTGVTFPNESPGLLRPVTEWSGLSIAAIPFGQEMKTTVLGLTNAYCAIANGGILHTPKLILGYRNPRTRAFRPHEYPESKRAISAPTALAVRDVLVAVTEYGGGQNGRVPGFRVAGKTGTAQVYDPEIRSYSRNKHVSSFVGFLPAERPQVVIAVVVNQPQGARYGNLVAAPSFANLAQALMKYLEIFPTDPKWKQEIAENLFVCNDANRSEQEIATPDSFDGQALVLGMTMRKAYEKIRRQGLDIKFEGSGIALVQDPLTTEQVPKTVEVRFYQPPRLNLN